MAKKKAAAHGGGHGWFVTFADLMGLLVAFFVMLVAFSTQDQKKLQIVAGSMREAFGVQYQIRYSGIIEVDGLPGTLRRPRCRPSRAMAPGISRRTAPMPFARFSRRRGCRSAISSWWRAGPTRNRCSRTTHSWRPIVASPSR